MSGLTTALILSGMALAVIWLYGAAKKAQGRMDAEAAAGKRIEAAKAATTERMQDADIVGDDPAAAKRWLAERVRNGPGQ